MLDKVTWSESRSYRTGSKYEPFQFYLDGLCNSTSLDLLLGYFSSSAINLLSLGFATFLTRGGTLRMIINNVLSQNDKDAIKRGVDGETGSFIINLNNIKELKVSLDEYGTHFFNCLAWLIANERIQIRIIKPKNGRGISHYKSGVFSDGVHTVGFKASCNFTAFGLVENLEELDAYLDWENTQTIIKINDQSEYFNSILNGENKEVEYLSVNDVVTAVRQEFGNPQISELLVVEKELIKRKTKVLENDNVKKSIEIALKNIDKLEEEPRFPYSAGPREYQIKAYTNWKNNNQQGLFAMATGTGKTLTALYCLLEIYKKTGYYKAMILVPTITLVNQWEQECERFNFNSITKVCSKSDWKNEFATVLTREKLFPTAQISYIIISTYASFARENIFTELNQLSSRTLLIADECHNMGSGTLLKRLPKINCKRRIGLSATPERQYDVDGNNKLFSFFSSVNSYTYEYSMEEAIKNKVLCRYFYFPHLVSLTEAEMKKYLDLSLKIAYYYNSDSDNFKNDSILTGLLLARKRLIHKAFNKLSAFRNIIKEQYQKKGNLKYTLVYVPEGNDPNDFFETDYYSLHEEVEYDDETVHLIDSFTNAVKEVDNRTTVKQFKSSTNEKENILEHFANGQIDVLTSMKCLDEGVDVPRAELAVFCASTGNPRQFVQRRGRILRMHPDKDFAFIHDLVVIPEVKQNSETYNMERSLLKKELERVKNFSLLSENSSHTINLLTDIMDFYNLNLYNNE